MDLLVDRHDLRVTRLLDEGRVALAPGQIRLRIEAFAITANNITYAVMGDAMKYWEFFPAQQGYGRVPVWGYASVIESLHVDVDEGERLYGFWPMSHEVVLSPSRVTDLEIVDGAAHRKPLPAVYNHYRRVGADPMHDPDREAVRMVCWPLFATAFAIDCWLVDEAHFGASQIVCSSASSRTAIATAHCLRASSEVRVVGLTSQRNEAFVSSLGLYHDVVGYDALDRLGSQASVYVDFSGDAALRVAVHDRLGSDLAFSSVVGATHWESMGGTSDVPGPAPEVFFAPDHIARRVASWGAGAWDERIGAVWADFARGTDDWLSIDDVHGTEAVSARYLDVLEGRSDPAVGIIASLWEDDAR